MAIRVEYGSAETVGQAAKQAGQAQAAQQQEQFNQQLTLQAMQNSARLQSQQMQINAQKEMTEFRSFIDKEAEMRKYAWQVERDDLVRRHDFEMLEQRKQNMIEIAESEDLRKLQQRQYAVDRVESMYKDGRLSQDEYENALLYVETGYREAKSNVDPIKQEVARILQAQGAVETGRSSSPIDNADPIVESNNRTALLNQAISSGNTQLARVASDGSYEDVLRALKNPEQKGRDIQTIQTSYLQQMLPTLNASDQTKLSSILASGKQDAINRAYKEVIDRQQKSWTKKSPQEIVNTGYERLAQMRQNSPEDF